MGIINHFSEGNNEQEYEGLHSHWKDDDKPINNESSLDIKYALDTAYNTGIDHCLEILLTWDSIYLPPELINSLTSLKKK